MIFCLVFSWGAVQAGERESSSTTVAVNIAPSIAVVAWPEGLVSLADSVVPGEMAKSLPLAIAVKANSLWGIEISCDLPDGRMKEFDLGTGAYVPDGSVLTQPLKWSLSPSGPWQPLSPDTSTIVSGQSPTDDSGRTVEFYLSFTADYGDRPLEAERDYRITLLYTAGLHY